MLSAQPKTAPYISVAEAAQMIDRSERTIWRWVEQGKIGNFKRNGQRCIVKAEIDCLLAEMPELARPLPERVEEVEGTLEDQKQRLAILEQNNCDQAEMNQQYDRKIRELEQAIVELQELLKPGKGRKERRLPSQPGLGRHYDPLLRGLPEGSLRSKAFTRMHLTDYDLLMQLHERGMIHLERHLMKGESGRYEWWVTPEQHKVIIRYYQQQHLPYKHCDDCPEESAILSI